MQVTSDAPPPAPAMKKRATKRGLCKTASAVPDDLPEVQSHVTSVYSSCVQRSNMFLSTLMRKPLLSKQSVNSAKLPEPEVVVEAVTRPKRKCVPPPASTSSAEVLSSVDLDDDDDLNDHENSMLSTDDHEASIIRSPSPPVPPPPPTNIRTRRRRVSKGIQNAFKAIDSIKGELRKGLLMSPQTPPVVVDSPEQSDDMLVRVRHINNIHRFSMSKRDMFFSLQVQMADLLGRRVEQVGLYLNDTRLAASDTPLSRKLHLADIIVCHILVAKPNGEEEDVNSADNIRIQMQCRNNRQKSTMIIKKFLPLKVMMEKYAQKQGKPVQVFRFQFDGERLQPGMLPSDVELDDDDTIDVIETES